MICRNCETDIQRADTFCPTCGSKTGVEAKTSFKWSLGCSGIGCSVALVAVIALIAIFTSPTNSNYTGPGLEDPTIKPLFQLGFTAVLGMSSAFIGLIFALIGLSKKNYKLAKKRK